MASLTGELQPLVPQGRSALKRTKLDRQYDSPKSRIKSHEQARKIAKPQSPDDPI
ncbi:MAG: hypothetical protein ACREBY_00695 [Polaromonas sp.]